MTGKISLSKPGIYVPSKDDERNVLTNSDLEAMTHIDTSDEWIFPRTGIKERRIEHRLSVPEMGVNAAYDCLVKNSIAPDEIDEIVFTSNKAFATSCCLFSVFSNSRRSQCSES